VDMVSGAWIVVDEEFEGAVVDLEALGVSAGCGVEDWDSLSESSSQPMFSAGERAAPAVLGVSKWKSSVGVGAMYLSGVPAFVPLQSR